MQVAKPGGGNLKRWVPKRWEKNTGRWRQLLSKTFQRWSDHDVPRLGAALSFYSLLSLAPLMMVLVPVSARLVGQPRAEQFFVHYASRLAGPVGAEALRVVIAGALKRSGGALPGFIALATLLFGATSIFTELRSDLNTIWEVQPPKTGNVIGSFIKSYLIAVVTVISLDVFLFVSILVTASAASMGEYLRQFVALPSPLIEASNFAATFVLTAVLIAMAFRFIPDRVIEWRAIWFGSLLAAFLEAIGKSLLGFYLGTAGIGSVFGAASSVFAIAIWIYYAAQIFFIGAEFTSAYASESREKRAIST